MSDSPVARRRLLDALGAIAEGRGDAESQTLAFRRALLDFGSETPDNLSCAQRLEVGVVGSETGLKLAGRPLLLGDIAHALEEAPMPDALRSACPDVTEAEWSAFGRVTTLLFVLLSRPERLDP